MLYCCGYLLILKLMEMNLLMYVSVRKSVNFVEIRDILALPEDSQIYLKNKIYEEWEGE